MRRIRIATTLAILTLGLAAAPGASAAPEMTFCVNDPSCVANGGIDQPTIAAAVTAANGNAGLDRIYLGASATPYVLSTGITLNQLRIIGAGEGSTTITGPVGFTAFIVGSSDSRLSYLTVNGNVGNDAAIHVSNGSNSTSSLNINHVAVTNSSTTSQSSALRVSGDAAIANATITGPATSNGTTYGFYVQGSGAVNLTDSQVRGDKAMYQTGGGTLTAIRNRAVFTHTGFETASPSTGAATTTTSQLSSLLLEGNPAGMATNAAGVRVYVNSTTATRAITLYAYNVTLVHSGVGGASAIPLGLDTYSGASSKAITFAFDGWSVSGPWTLGFYIPIPDGSTTYPSSAISHVNFFPAQTSNNNGTAVAIDPSSSFDPKYVNATARDFHLRWDSPLLDIGATFLSPFEGDFDVDGQPRNVNKTGTGAIKLDYGAYEYNRTAPRIVSSNASGAVTPGASLTYDVTATDANAGEAAALTYLWTLPDGTTRTGSNVTFTAPSAAGSYTVSVVVTDLSGLTASAASTLVVPAATQPPTAAPPVLADLDPPKVSVKPGATTLAKLLKRATLLVTLTPNEAVSAKVSLLAKVTLPPVRRGAKPRVTTVVVATASLAQGTGARVVKLVPTKLGIGKVVALRRTRGAVVAWSIDGVATDAGGNRTKLVAKVVAR